MWISTEGEHAHVNIVGLCSRLQRNELFTEGGSGAD